MKKEIQDGSTEDVGKQSEEKLQSRECSCCGLIKSSLIGYNVRLSLVPVSCPLSIVPCHMPYILFLRKIKMKLFLFQGCNTDTGISSVFASSTEINVYVNPDEKYNDKPREEKAKISSSIQKLN